jgi:hypothetical protein
LLQVTIHHPDGAAERLSFTKPEVLIGRRVDNDIVLASPDVSSAHACLRRDEAGVCLIDLASTNGSFVNGRKIQLSAPLLPADEIKIAGFRIQIGDPERVAVVTAPTIAPASAIPHVAARPPPPVLSTWDTDLPPLIGQDLAEAPPLATLRADHDLPPLVARRGLMPAQPSTPPVALATPASGQTLAQRWRTGDVRALLIDPDGLVITTYEGASLRLPPPAAEEVDALLGELAPGIAQGRAGAPAWLEHGLADGSVLRVASAHGCVSLRRPPPPRLRALTPEHHSTLLAGLRRRAVIAVAAPGDLRAALLQEIGAAMMEPGALIRLALEPVQPAASVLIFDPPALAAAAAVRLVRDLERAWIAIDRPDAAALVALAELRGVAILIGVDDADPGEVAVTLRCLRPEILVSAPAGSSELRVELREDL